MRRPCNKVSPVFNARAESASEFIMLGRHSRTRTSTQGIRNCHFSSRPRNHSNPLTLAGAAEVALALLRFTTPSSAALANEPPVPLIAENAMLAVSLNASVNVALPLSSELAVSLITVLEGCQRGSNQLAWKSNREKTRTKSRMEQYTHGRWMT